MVITHFGKAYFKLTLGDLTIAINPPSKESKEMPKPARFGADIALVSLRHPDYDGPETVSLGDKEPFVIDGPGSYEIKDIFFTGASSTTIFDGKEKINTVYSFELDNIKIAFMGILNNDAVLSGEAKEIASIADIIFVPVGGGNVYDSAKAYKQALAFEPNVIIPYEYDEPTLARFLKEGGQEKAETVEKYTVKRRDLDGKQGAIVVIDSRA